MKLVKRKIRQLKGYENNARHNQEAVIAVYNSIKKYGYLVPIVIDDFDVIAAGHTRQQALLRLLDEGFIGEEIDCILADDLTEEQIAEFRLADNITAGVATWDLTKLKIELELLPNFEADMFGDIPALTVEEIQIQEEAKIRLEDGKIFIKVGPDSIEITEQEYYMWTSYVVESHNMTLMDFVRQQLHLDEKDRVYPRLEI